MLVGWHVKACESLPLHLCLIRERVDDKEEGGSRRQGMMHSGGWCTVVMAGAERKRDLWRYRRARKRLLDFFHIVLSMSVSLVPFPFPTLLCFFIVHFFFVLLYLAEKTRFVLSPKRHFVYIFALFFLYFSLSFANTNDEYRDITVNNIAASFH